MNNQLNQEKFKKITEEIIWAEDISRARSLIVKIENLFKERPDLSVNQPQFYQHCQDVLIKLKFVALPTLSDRRAFDLIKGYFLYALKADIDVSRISEINLCSRPVFARGEFKKGARQALKENQQKIGRQSLSVKGKSAVQPPTLKNWLLDYDQTVGIKKHSELEREQYLAQNSNVRKLNQAEKDLLRKALKFYDGLKPAPVSQVEKWIEIARNKGMIPPFEELEAISPTLPPRTPTETPKAVRPSTPSPSLSQSAPLPARPTPTPTEPSLPSPLQPAEPKPSRRDIYQEPIKEEPEPSQIEPKIKGNVVDLKNQ